MKCSINLKMVLLSLLLVNLVIRSVEAYSFIRNFNEKNFTETVQNIYVPSVEVAPVEPPAQRPVVYSSNVVMVWHKSDSELGIHMIDTKSFDKLVAQAQLMTSEEVEQLTTEAQNMSTEEFIALINTKNIKEQVEYRMLLARNKQLN